jgi:hypothetical protein
LQRHGTHADVLTIQKNVGLIHRIVEMIKGILNVKRRMVERMVSLAETWGQFLCKELLGGFPLSANWLLKRLRPQVIAWRFLASADPEF